MSWTLDQLLPHRGPMLLLDEMVEVDAERIVCTAAVRSDSPFVRDGLLQAPALMEYMAQAMAAFVGYQGRFAGGEDVPRGYVVGARDLEIAGTEIRPGDELRIEARLCEGIGGYASYEGCVEHQGRVVCTGTLKVFCEAEEGDL